jgi:hypothetical protein
MSQMAAIRMQEPRRSMPPRQQAQTLPLGKRPDQPRLQPEQPVQQVNSKDAVGDKCGESKSKTGWQAICAAKGTAIAKPRGIHRYNDSARGL